MTNKVVIIYALEFQKFDRNKVTSHGPYTDN